MASNLSTAVSSTLRSEIVSGSLPPGSRLPSEAALIERFSVSRTVIRESLGRLRAEGLIRSVRGSGSFVLAQPQVPGRSPSGTELTPPIDHSSLLEFRIAIETEAAALGANRRTAAELEAIAGALQALEASGADPAASLQADLDFHRAVAEASHNTYFTTALETLGPAMIAVPDERLRAQPQHMHRVTQEHHAVHDCFISGDALGAAAAMRTHLTQSLLRLRAVDDERA